MRVSDLLQWCFKPAAYYGFDFSRNWTFFSLNFGKQTKMAQHILNSPAGFAEEIFVFHPATLQWWPQDVLGIPKIPADSLDSYSLVKLSSGYVAIPGRQYSFRRVVEPPQVSEKTNGIFFYRLLHVSVMPQRFSTILFMNATAGALEWQPLQVTDPRVSEEMLSYVFMDVVTAPCGNHFVATGAGKQEDCIFTIRGSKFMVSQQVLGAEGRPYEALLGLFHLPEMTYVARVANGAVDTKPLIWSSRDNQTLNDCWQSFFGAFVAVGDVVYTFGGFTVGNQAGYIDAVCCFHLSTAYVELLPARLPRQNGGAVGLHGMNAPPPCFPLMCDPCHVCSCLHWLYS